MVYQLGYVCTISPRAIQIPGQLCVCACSRTAIYTEGYRAENIEISPSLCIQQRNQQRGVCSNARCSCQFHEGFTLREKMCVPQLTTSHAAADCSWSCPDQQSLVPPVQVDLNQEDDIGDECDSAWCFAVTWRGQKASLASGSAGFANHSRVISMR